ncbi:MAG: hypothetical protein JWO72_2529 [Caulobacteraceae bacterium]|nr:hypothetical protein [Caulobacteraceae bacterium]
MSSLSADTASAFARIALGHVEREYPNKLDHVLDGDGDRLGPRALHPIFYGSFDWHSCVHGYWTLATVLRLHPQIAEAPAVRALFDRAFTADKVEAECAYLRRPSARGFERPYGWGWLLKLQAELLAHGAHWAGALQPLADMIVARFYDYLPRAAYPVRAGVHSNTAFALALATDYATVAGDADLRAVLEAKARDWYLPDRDAPAWEPSGDDFLSPTLIEAECLRRLLPPAEFTPWLAAFLPRAAQGQPQTLFVPAGVSDRSDGKIAHLDGLNLSRAWCWRRIAAVPPPGDPMGRAAADAADRHLAAGLPHVAGDYMGEHWLASFALLALTAG